MDGAGRSNRGRLRLLLESSSVAALLIGVGAPPAFACYTGPFAGGYVNVGATACITVSNTSFTGYLQNVGTISPGPIGIAVINNSTINGQILDSGTISVSDRGILIDGTSQINGFNVAINISGSTFVGGISNAGTISAFFAGVVVGNAGSGAPISIFSGGITNSGKIVANTGAGVGIMVGGFAESASAAIAVSSFGGGISNSGTITTPNFAIGIRVGGSAAFHGAISISNFSGGISNSGNITARTDIFVGGTAFVGGSLTISTFSGGITNSGTISTQLGNKGIWVGGNALGPDAVFGISTVGGGIINSGSIAAANRGIMVGGLATSGARFTISTFAGGISNAGTISVNAGAAIMVAASAVNHGTMAIATFGGGISNSGTISAGVGRGILVGGSAVGVGASAVISTFGGGISNSGLIVTNTLAGIKVGSIARTGGTLTISTFGGGIVNSGTISAGSVGILIGGTASGAAKVAVSTFSGGITNSGTIVARTGVVIYDVSTFVGAIANSGVIIGTGGTAIDISAAPNGMTVDIAGGAISGNIVGSGTENGDTVNFALGSGTFAYANTITGMQTVNVDSGTLFDGGSIIAGSVNVNAGGVLAPGLPHSIGTLNITGNLVFAAAAAYLDTISGASASKTVVTGTAALGGASVEIASGSTIRFYTRYTILTDTGGGIGGGNIFSPTVTYEGHSGTLSYDADDVYLMFAGPSNLAAQLPPGAPTNAVNVANSLDNFTNGGGTLPPQFYSLFNTAPQQLVQMLTRLDGESATGAETSAFQLMTEFLDLMLDPFVNGRGFASGGGASGGAIGFAPDERPSLPPEIVEAYAEVFKAPPKPNFDQRWSAWGTAYGGSNTAQGNAAVGSNTINASTYGVAGGMDYRVSPHTILGFALAGGGAGWGLANALGSGYSEALQIGGYGITWFGPAYLSGALAFNNNWFTTNRSALGDQLTANFSGQSYGVRVEGGYRVPVWHTLGLTPYAAVAAQDFATPNFSETDKTGGGLGLSYAAMNATDVRTELGARFDDPMLLYGKPLIAFGRLAWAHDFVRNPALSAAFEALPGSSFTVFGAPLPHDSALTSAGVQYFLSSRWSLVASFYGNFASGYQTEAGTGTLRYTW